MTKETKTIKELKKVNHKLKHQYDLLQIRYNALNGNYDLDIKTMNEMIRRYMIVHDELLKILDKGSDK